MTTDLGALVAGRFRIERNLGSGGMADVFAATDLATKRPVAVKLLKKDIAQNPEATERLRREGEVLQKLDHPAIVRLETFGKLEDGRLFIAMELLEGETLGERIRRLGRMDPSDLAPIVAGACSGLHAAHERGIVHRDLKPDNVFLATSGTEIKLLDFGISKITGSDKLTQTGEVLGTPRYMAPEQLSAERDLDGRTDVYALGVILYEALAGTPPFLASTPTDLLVAILHGKHAPLRSFRPDLSRDLEAVVTRAMSRAREARYASARELAEAFIDVAQPSGGASAPATEPREGMTTAPMGSVGDISGEHPVDAPAPTPPPDAPEQKEDLRPGTFSALAAAPAEIAPPVAAVPTPTIMERPRQRADVFEGPAVPAQPGEAAGPYELPTKGKHTWLIVGAVLAGALSAAIAILALKLSANEDDAALETARPAAARPAEPAPARPPEEPPPEVAAPAADELPEGIATPEETDAAAEPAKAPPARRRSRRRRSEGPTGASGDQAPAGGEAAEAPSAADLMREARAALRSGDARACVTLVERAMEVGASSSALRLRGDCLIRAGNREEGLRSYERFCLLAPDHPAISEVRALVESLGGRCR